MYGDDYAARLLAMQKKSDEDLQSLANDGNALAQEVLRDRMNWRRYIAR